MVEAHSEAAEHGFRHPPEIITTSCRDYMARVMELRGFLSVFFGSIKSLQYISSAISNGILKFGSIDNSSEESIEYKHHEFKYAHNEQFVSELTVSRAIETFDLYLISILREIFTSKPEMLKSEGKIDIATVLEFKDAQGIISYISEKKLHDLSYKPLSELRDYIDSRTGISLFKDDTTFKTVLVASEVRNLIAHNDCRMNEQFRRRTREVESEIVPRIREDGKLILTDRWMRVISYTLDSVVFDFDAAASAKFRLKANRIGETAILPREAEASRKSDATN